MRIAYDPLFGDLPKAAASYALPEDLRSIGLRRYGGDGDFHGWVLRQVKKLRARRIISIHLGDHPNYAAFDGRDAVDTSLGLTFAEGLPAATTCGSLDPSIPLLLAEQGMQAEEIERILLKESGWLALAGVNTLPDLMHSAAPGAELARGILQHGLEQGIGAMMAALGGTDAIVFGSEYLEEAVPLARAVSESLSFLGVRLLPEETPMFKVEDAWRLTTSESTIPIYWLDYLI